MLLKYLHNSDIFCIFVAVNQIYRDAKSATYHRE